MRFIRLDLVGVSLALALVTSAANAGPEEDLARAKGCLACHSAQQKIVGPAYKDVAAKYAGQPDAEAKLVDKVIKGGQGVWGFVPMPPNDVTPGEAQKLVQWVLSTK